MKRILMVATAALCGCAHHPTASPPAVALPPPAPQAEAPAVVESAPPVAVASEASPPIVPASNTPTAAAPNSQSVTPAGNGQRKQGKVASKSNSSASKVTPASSGTSPPPPKVAGEPASAAVPSRAATQQAAQPVSSGPPPLDLPSLEQRLRDTKAIGVFTKLSLKNQVDDLLGALKAFHAGQHNPPLTELRESFETLLLKVVSVLQKGDPQLASAISSSRDAIWGVLSDPKKFAQLS